MAAGWAIAGDTPFTWAKQIGSDFGGTRNGMVVHWPKRINAKGELRSQFAHVIDVAPTVLDAAGLPEPRLVDGVAQVPIQGQSLIPTFVDAKAPMRRTQYFEIIGNRAIYHDGWYARVIHKAPWERVPRATLQDDEWELYDTRKDFSLVNNVAAQHPQKLEELQDLFMREAKVNHVLPIDDRGIERLNPQLAGRPDLMGGRTSLTLYGGMKDLSENVFINTKNKSHSITADVDIPAGSTDGVILSQGGRFGGWSFYLKDGKPSYTYNFLGLNRTTIAANNLLSAGKSTLRYEFTYDGGGIGKGGNGRIFVNDKVVAEGRIERTQGMIFSLDESADVGRDNGTPVLEDYHKPHGVFGGSVYKVAVKISGEK
jgi:arylsulfatase